MKIVFAGEEKGPEVNVRGENASKSQPLGDQM